MPQTTSDRNLLFGILALDLNFIGPDDLISAMHAWLGDKEKSLATILRDAGKLKEEDCTLLEQVVHRHVEIHHKDVGQSLAAVSPNPYVLDVLKKISDGDVAASVAYLTVAPPDTGDEGTRDYVPPGQSAPGARFRKGAWHIDGGIGRIFHADDMELHRDVAFKELKEKFADSPEYRAALVREAQVTGGLEHPGVVPVYGLEADPNGRPYYAMRFLRGQTLKDSIREFHEAGEKSRSAAERRLDLHRLLRRFIDVCNTVAYAHSRGALHRDLKPGNIVLGKYGETILIDWGMARTGVTTSVDGTAPTEPEEGLLKPTAHARPKGGTAGFMSPEQAAEMMSGVGAAVPPPTHASDVFSLGCILYVLLTGRKHPYAADEYKEILAQTVAGEMVSPETAKPGVPKALVAICLKAMALAPEERYQSALDLAADVEHWLADEPVPVYRDPWTVKFARWGRRHRLALVGTAVFLVTAVSALSASTAVVWAEQRETARQKQQAEKNWELAVSMGFDGLGLMERAEATLAADPVLHGIRKNVLRHAETVFRRHLEENRQDPERRKRAAAVYRYKANVHRLENQTKQAEELLVETVTLLQGLALEGGAPLDIRDRQALALRDYASLQARLGQLDYAKLTIDQAVQLAQNLEKWSNNELRFSRTEAAALLVRAGIELSKGDYAEAGATADQAADRFARLLKAPPEKRHPYDRLLLAASLNMRAATERRRGQLSLASKTHEEAIEHLTAMQESPPKGVNLYDILNYLASCRLEQCRTWAKFPEKRAAARANLEAAASQWRELAQVFPTYPDYRERQAEALLGRGQMLLDDNLDGAREDLIAARDLLVPAAGQSVGIPSYQANLGETYLALGQLAAAQHADKEAAQFFSSARAAISQAVRLSPRNKHYRDLRDKLPKSGE